MPKTPFYEGFEANGLTIERFGRFMRTSVNRTPDEYAAHHAQMRALHQKLPGQIAENVRTLEDVISNLDPLDVIANAGLANAVIDVKNYKEWAFEGQQCFVEYISLLCLKRQRWTSSNRMVTAAEHEPVNQLLKAVFDDTQLMYMTEFSARGNPGEPPDLMDEIRFFTRLNELRVRFPGYEHHQKELLNELFLPYADWMNRALGLAIADAIALIGAVDKLTNSRLRERFGAAREELKALRSEVRDYSRGKDRAFKYPGETLKKLSSLREKEMLKETKNLTTAWGFFGLGNTLSFGASEMADLAGVTVATAESFLDLFSMTFGDVPSSFSAPELTNSFRLRPIVNDESRYLCPSTGALLWAIRPRIETAMNPASGESAGEAAVWQKYTKHRGDWLEQEALGLLALALPAATSHRSLKYKFDAEPERERELDGLVQFDRVLILLEAKSGTMKDAARRGAPESLLTSLEGLVGDAHAQALRAKEYIDSTDKPLFRTPSGNLELDKSSFDEVMMMTVTLDSLSVFPPILHRIAHLNIFPAGTLPWTVPIMDLRVICEIIEFPAQLVHFIRRRLRVSELAILSASEELDYFGHYLTDGLYFEDFVKDKPSEINLLSYTDQFDAFYFTEMGYRTKPAGKPRQKVPDDLRALILELEKRHPEGYVDVVCQLLDFDGETRRRIARQFLKLARLAKKDGVIHNFSVMNEDEKHGVSLFCGHRAEGRRIHEQMETYCLVKKYQQRYVSWLGIGITAENPLIPIGFVNLKGAWANDPSLEAASVSFLRPGREIRLS